MALPEVPENLENLAKLQEFLISLRNAIPQEQSSGIVPNGSVPFTGDQSMGGNKLTNVGTPTAGGDAANKTYVDAGDTTLTNLVNSLDANNIKKDGSVPFTADQPLGGFKLVNVANPILAQDAATKAYVDASGGAATPLTAQETYVPGVIGVGSTSYTVVTGTTMTIPVVVSQVVVFVGQAEAGLDFASRSCVQLGLRVDGIDYDGTFSSSGPFGNAEIKGVTVNKALVLSPGVHTAELVAKTLSGVGASVTLSRLVATYTEPAAIPPITVSLSSQHTGPFAATFNPPIADTYDPIPSSSIVLSLNSTTTVMLLAYTTFVDPGSNSINAQLGVRVTSPGPVVVDYDGSRLGGGNDMNRDTSMLSRAISLGAGSHTIELIAKSSGGATYEYENAHLTVVYTTPQAVQPAVFSFMADATRTSGDFAVVDTAGAWADVPGPGVNPTFDLVFTPSVTGKARVTIQGSAWHDNSRFGFNLRVNGVDLLPAGTDVIGGATVPRGYVVIGHQGANGEVGNISFSTLIDVTATVSTTVRLRYMADLGGGTNLLLATSGRPLSMTVEYN